MHIDTGNFHVFFPKGCYRNKITPRRKEIFAALDKIIQEENFDMDLFYEKKQAYLDALNSEKKEKETLLELNALIGPLFSLMIKQGFLQKELQNYEGCI